MFEAKLADCALFKKLIESIKDLVTDINLDVAEHGISLQAMDGSHVALVTLLLKDTAFEYYRCDRQMTLGVSITNLSKIMKCGGVGESLNLSADDQGSTLNITFANKGKY